MKVNQVSDRPASSAFYSVAGRLLFVESPDIRLRNLIIPLFAGWQLTRIYEPDKSPDIRITFTCGVKLAEHPSNLNQFEIAEGGRCYTTGADVYLALGDSVMHLVGSTPLTVDISLAEVPDPGDPLLATIASFAVCAALRRFGLFDLHSAGVVNPDNGKGVLIIGPSGSGKSTLTLNLGRAGWPYLSDDNLLLSLVDGEVEARGFRTFFAVNTGQPLKSCFEPEVVFGSQRRTQASPGVLLFTTLSGEKKSLLSKLTQAETMTRLIRACPWATYDTAIAGANLEVLSALARQATGFDLSAGRDLLAPGHAAEVLRGVATEGHPYNEPSDYHDYEDHL
ncbi:MAG TPA: hypothetical protein VFT44_02475 [Pyrinomonadaceae bacterium]|nr:hypothetical protein [Pyrinomonadaceae bacterium]